MSQKEGLIKSNNLSTRTNNKIAKKPKNKCKERFGMCIGTFVYILMAFMIILVFKDEETLDILLYELLLLVIYIIYISIIVCCYGSGEIEIPGNLMPMY